MAMQDVQKTNIKRRNSVKRMRRRKRMMPLYMLLVLLLVVGVGIALSVTGRRGCGAVYAAADY